MLRLHSATDGPWLGRALAHLDEILVDHAHCEKKAASTAVSLLFKYPDRPALLAPLSRLAREELAHFEEVLAALAARGIRFRHQMPSPYAAGLHRAVRSREPERLLDALLCSALIEARSCERLRLLAGALDDAALAELYRGLLAAEARHHQTYIELATTVAPLRQVHERLSALAAHEASVLAAAPPLPRLHT
ncbi:MAG TPA: tRNA-(ms[2]io[6]A)-hydroxylase [Candidatus Binatus sp.]|jgi:tRNA 2-(methylsulfanyl)-N6-isopentenyladenosine37 hydroxylase|nr:tRNA-(ms[2]io[6]A)-hydroxylase [Candidatus Binatus sp.]